MTEAAFWDTSGIVLLCCHQPASSSIRKLAQARRRMVVWWGMSVEARSAFARLVREEQMTDVERGQSLVRLDAVRRACAEILPSEEVRSLAERLPDAYRLRAGDAFQLAAALVHCSEKPRKRPFVCLDRALAEAAASAGFTVVPRR